MSSARSMMGNAEYIRRWSLAIMCLLMVTGCTERTAVERADLDSQLASARRDGKIVMLELGSVGCIPCENMKPVMEKLRNYYGNRLEVIFIDVKQERNLAARYKVFSIPVQVFINARGEEFHRHVGFYPYEEIQPILSSVGL